MKKVLNLSKFKKICRQHPLIIAAYLTGSVAEKRERKDSDLDIILLVERNFSLKCFGELYQKINRLISHPNLDLRLVTLEETDPLFLFQLLQGKQLFARDKQEIVVLEVKIMKLYYDSQHLRNIFHYYLNQRLEKGTYGR